jgi:hypothetical protein
MATKRVELVRAIAVQLKRTSREVDSRAVAEVIDGSARIAGLYDSVYRAGASGGQWGALLRDVARFWEQA